MNKNAFILLLMLWAGSLQAHPVTPSKAMEVAERFFAAQAATKSSAALSIVWDGEDAPTRADVTPAFYVVGREGGGFVIVAGDDNTRPILGFSFENRFEPQDMPCNVKAWMDNLKEYCRTPRFATPQVVRQWAAFAATRSKEITGSLTIVREVKAGGRSGWTVPWGQTGASNLFCPVIDGERAVCGCIPLAVSEIMTWFGYPDKGKGTVGAYHAGGVSIPEHDLTTVYDWAGLQSLTTPEAYKAQENTPLGENLGHLVYDVGTILRVTYGTDGTSGNVTRLVDYLNPPMAYSLAAAFLDHDDYNPKEWDDMISREIDRHPIYYTGHDGSNGHAYVLDGYADFEEYGDRAFHVNFGWTGKCNGYYFSDGQDSGGSGQNYRRNSALFGFEPDPDGTSTFVYSLNFVMDYNGNEGGGLTLLSPIEDGKANIKCTNIVNTGNDNTYYELEYVLESQDGTFRPEPLLHWNGANLKPGSYWANMEKEVPVPADVTFGEQIALNGMLYGDTPMPVHFANPSVGLAAIPLFPAAFIDTRNNPQDGWFYFRLTNHDYPYPNAAWFITDAAGNTARYNQSDWRVHLSPGQYTVKAVTGKESIVATIKVE